MDWNQTLERLKADKGSWSRIAEATGLSANQIRRYVHGDTKSPKVAIAQRIADYYASQTESAEQ